MAADEKVIDAEFFEDKPSQVDSENIASFTAKTVARGLEQAGFHNAADKARAVAEVVESAQETYQAVKPAMNALSKFVKVLEDKGFVTYQTRPPLRRPS